MNQIQILQQQLGEASVYGQDYEVETLVATYVAAKESIADLVDIQAGAKGRISQIIRESGIDVWDTRSGKVIVPADATIVTYDSTALDRLASASGVFRRKVFPFRHETFRAGGIRILSK